MEYQKEASLNVLLDYFLVAILCLKFHKNKKYTLPFNISYSITKFTKDKLGGKIPSHFATFFVP